MYFNYVEIINQELIVKSLPTINYIPDVLVEIAQIRETQFCYFNKNRWYNFFKLLLSHQSAHIKDVTKLLLYGDVWLHDFKLYHGELQYYAPYEQDVVWDEINKSLFCFLRIENIPTDKLLNLYNFYYKCKKNLREVLNVLFVYPQIREDYLFDNVLVKEDFSDLPKGWKDKLTQLNKLLNINTCKYVSGKTFRECFDVLRTIKTYSKKYGVYFDKLFADGVAFQLDDPDSVRQVFYYHLHKNNRLLCEPLQTGFDLLGKWKLVELNTTYGLC